MKSERIGSLYEKSIYSSLYSRDGFRCLGTNAADICTTCRHGDESHLGRRPQSAGHSAEAGTYEQGVVLKAIEQMWYATGDPKYFRHIQKGMDYWIDENGNHKDYHLEEYNIDHVTPGTGDDDALPRDRATKSIERWSSCFVRS